jgi:putative phage-type endonuclease
VTTPILKELPKKLGEAEFVANLEDGSAEWHELRKTGIGGSDVGTITKCNPWSSPFALWAKKTGRIEDQLTDSEPAEWGKRLEPVVLDKFEEKHPELYLHRNVGTWKHQDRHWQLANPDAIAYDADKQERYIIEIKTAQFEDQWQDGVPLYYRTQVQWYLQTFGFKKAFVAVLWHGNKFGEFEVLADQFEQGTNLAEVEKFRTYLDQDTQPDYDGALSTYETIRELHPDIEDDEVELGDLGIHYLNAQTEFDQAQEKFNEMKSRVMDAMGKAKRGLIEDKWMLTRQARNGGRPFLINKRG